jgi:ppGpp synthetase/RelA/SpoT-type nucleotidyltranferase
LTVLIPDSVRRAYEEEVALIEPLRKFAGSRLRIIAADRSWLFDDRVKSPESCLSKLEAGFPSLREMHDVYAAMLVVPTLNQLDAASEAVLRAFNGQVKATRTDEPSSFVYDDLHVIATLRGRISPRAVPHPAVLDRRFEIQIHTGVQYAWWRATHDGIYKGSPGLGGDSWAVRRASGQARASLELIDGVLADFAKAAQLQRHASRGVEPDVAIGEWLKAWAPARRPSDVVRFAKTAQEIVTAAEISLDDVGSLLRGGTVSRYVADPRLTPIQTVVVCCHILGGDPVFQRLGEANRRILVTDEAIDTYRGFERVSLAGRVVL